jgi:hypothetical protein
MIGWLRTQPMFCHVFEKNTNSSSLNSVETRFGQEEEEEEEILQHACKHL